MWLANFDSLVSACSLSRLKGSKDALANDLDTYIGRKLLAACMFDLLAPFKVAGGRFRFYWEDWRNGLHRKVFSSALLIFLTSVGPAMSFGEYLSNNLEGSYGVLEVLVTTALCGTIFSLISGSPLVIVGATGPFSIFGFNCFRLARSYGLPFLPWMSWILLISGLQHIFLGLISASTWYLPYITSFSGQVFGVLISMIYIVESCQNVAESFYQGASAGRLDAAFFYSIIAFGQLAACMCAHICIIIFVCNDLNISLLN